MQRSRKMLTLRTFSATVFLCGFVAVSVGQAVHEKTSPTSGKMSFKTPDLSDEEAYSLHLPQELKCDACRIVAFTMREKFDGAHKKRPSLKTLPESQILDILDEICTNRWEHIGLKEIDGVKRLSGPGLETKDVPGVMQGGGKWPNRLNQQCSYYIGEFGEDEIYEIYLENPKKFEKWLCYSDNGDCVPKEEPKKMKGKKNKAKTEL